MLHSWPEQQLQLPAQDPAHQRSSMEKRRGSQGPTPSWGAIDSCWFQGKKEWVFLRVCPMCWWIAPDPGFYEQPNWTQQAVKTENGMKLGKAWEKDLGGVRERTIGWVWSKCIAYMYVCMYEHLWELIKLFYQNVEDPNSVYVTE